VPHLKQRLVDFAQLMHCVIARNRQRIGARRSLINNAVTFINPITEINPATALTTKRSPN
jgi:hypothetical protein